MSGWGPPPQGYGPPPPQAAPAYPVIVYRPPPANNSLAVASFVCGILAIVPGCCCGLFDFPLSVMALVMGVIGLSQINASGGQIGGKGLAIAGMVCGAFGLFVSVGSATFHLSQYVTRTLHI